MKRLLGSVIVSILLLSVLSGALPALAQDEENTREVSVSTEVISVNQTTTQVYSVNDRLMSELDRLVIMLREAENEGDRELIAALREKIQIIKEEISRTTEESAPTTVTGVSLVAVSLSGEKQEEDKPTVTSTGGTNVVSSLISRSFTE